MTSWRDALHRVTIGSGTDQRRLIGASFRGVPFLVADVGRTGGRRAVSHEFPLRDDNYVEDLGRKERKFSVEGYVLGADYVAQRDALLAALEDTSGPGQLAHPTYGLRRAVCTSLAVKESLGTDGGVATFSLEFVEAPAQAVAPVIDEDLPGNAGVLADAAQAAVSADLVASYDVEDLPSWALASAERAIASASADLSSFLAPIVETASEAAALNQKLSVITAKVAELARDPAEALTSFLGALGAFAGTTAAAPQAVVDALLSASDFPAGEDAPTTTATRARERANQLAINRALRLVMVIAAARAAVTIEFASVEDAEATRDAVTTRLDDQTLAAGDGAYPALVELRAWILHAIPGNRVLARVVTVVRNVPVPSLVLAHGLYGSVELEADVVARNRVRHPGFVAGELRVLSDDV